MAALVGRLPRFGWELEAILATVGSDGHWPHAMAFWRVPDEDALVGRLEAGGADGFDESEVVEGSARLYRPVRGAIPPGAGAFLVEHVVVSEPRALLDLAGPDLVLAEELGPWQGLLLWAADDLFALARREEEGLGSTSDPRCRQVTGWWATRMPEREIV
jgi:hypothetical protein